MDAHELTLQTIGKSSTREVFMRELKRVAADLGDVNTSVKQTRSITLTFKFTPFPDRSGATVETKCHTNLADLDCSAATDTVYLAKINGQFTLFSRDLRQELLFDDGNKNAAAGEAAP